MEHRQALDGEIALGSKIKLVSTLLPSRTFSLRVTEFQPNARLTFGDAMSTRTYSLTPDAGGTRVKVVERIASPFFPFLARMIPSFDENFEQRFTWGGSLSWMGAGVFGFEVDYSLTPNFFQINGADEDVELFDLDSSIQTLMGNVIGTPRPDDDKLAPFPGGPEGPHAPLSRKLSNAELHGAVAVLFISDRESAKSGDRLMTFEYTAEDRSPAAVPALHLRRTVADKLDVARPPRGR